MPEAVIDTPAKHSLITVALIVSQLRVPSDFTNPDKNLWSASESCYFPFLKIYCLMFSYILCLLEVAEN